MSLVTLASLLNLSYECHLSLLVIVVLITVVSVSVISARLDGELIEVPV